MASSPRGGEIKVDNAFVGRYSNTREDLNKLGNIDTNVICISSKNLVTHHHDHPTSSFHKQLFQQSTAVALL